ncbi:MAG: hypothetical protein Q7R45_07290 [Sulfuricaulis sp.]|nr:hypothetical protein [Sulfuricaulis sp.]
MADWDFETHEPAPRVDEFSSLCARVFHTTDGVELLKMLRAMTVERALPVTATDAALRDLNAQCRLVRQVEVATARGVSRPATPLAKK